MTLGSFRNPNRPRQRLPLHHLLKAYETNPQPLDVSIVWQTDSDTGAVIVNAKGGAIPAGFATPETARQAIISMLRHYPAPARVNGQPVARTEFVPRTNLRRFIQSPGFTRARQQPVLENTASADPGPPVIYAEGLTYRQENPRTFTAAVPEAPTPENGPAFIKAEFWQMQPDLALTPRQAAYAEYEETEHGYVHCNPYDYDEATAGQISEANAVIRETSPWTPEPQWRNQRRHAPEKLPNLEQIWTLGQTGAWVIPQPGQTAAWPDAGTPQATVHSLARALLQNPQAGIIPAEKRENRETLVRLEQAVITWPDGETQTFHQEELEDGVDFSGKPDHIFQPDKAIAASITLHARLTAPDQPELAVQLPADLLCMGYPWENTTFITRANAGPHTIAELEVEALWNNDEEQRHQDPQPLKDHLTTWWTRAFQGNEAAFQQELDLLAGNFYHQSPGPADRRTAMDGAKGASLTWRPPHTWDWLDDIIRRHAPDADIPTLRRITEAAQRILETAHPDTLHQAVQKAIENHRTPE